MERFVKIKLRQSMCECCETTPQCISAQHPDCITSTSLYQCAIVFIIMMMVIIVMITKELVVVEVNIHNNNNNNTITIYYYCYYS